MKQHLPLSGLFCRAWTLCLQSPGQPERVRAVAGWSDCSMLFLIFTCIVVVYRRGLIQSAHWVNTIPAGLAEVTTRRLALAAWQLPLGQEARQEMLDLFTCSGASLIGRAEKSMRLAVLRG